MAKALAAGEIKAARSMARQRMDFKGKGLHMYACLPKGVGVS
jgi:hypothetical protein